MDSELREHVLRAQEGDLDAYCYVAAACREQAVRMARTILGEPHRAEDAAQEALLVAFQKLPTLETPEAFPGWLAVIARRIALRAAKRRRSDLLEPEQAARIESPDEPDPLQRAELRSAVRAAIADLRPRTRQAIESHYLRGLSVNETARTLGVPAGTVKRRLWEGRQHLRRPLSGWGPDLLSDEDTA